MTALESIQSARVGPPRGAADGSFACEFCFRAQDTTFAGHFPGRPLVPGAYQIEMARVAAEAAAGRPLALREVWKAKFLRPIVPEETVLIELKLEDKDGTIRTRATFSVNGRPAGELVLILAPTL